MSDKSSPNDPLLHAAPPTIRTPGEQRPSRVQASPAVGPQQSLSGATPSRHGAMSSQQPVAYGMAPVLEPGPAAAISVDPTMPPPLLRAMRELNEWAGSNDSDAKRDRIRYWILKAPAIFCSLGAAALEAFGLGAMVVVASLIGGFCAAIDAVRPGGQLHNAHRRAANELRTFANQLSGRWDQILLRMPADSKERREAIASLIGDVEAERQRVNDYITAAEAALDAASKHSAAGSVSTIAPS